MTTRPTPPPATTTTPPPVWGLVLTGGRSRRMGEDKALLSYTDDDVDQVTRTVHLLQSVCEDVVVSRRRDQQDRQRSAHRTVDDAVDAGPAGGLLAAFDVRDDVAWLVVAVDLPFLDVDVLQKLVDARSPHRMATAFAFAGGRFDDDVEPLCTLYEPAFAPVLRAGLADGQRSLRRLLRGQNVVRLPAEERALHNVNTPDERDAARR